jgi:cathepsin L
MKVAIALCVAAVAVVAVSAVTEREYQSQFVNYISQFDKTYAHEEFFNRYNIFKSWVDHVAEHNAGNHTWQAGINQFSDLTAAEFKAQYLSSLIVPEGDNMIMDETPLDMSGPSNDVDWRTKGAVTPVKNQGQCGSCWAFSATGSIEGAWFLAKGQLVSVAEQQLVDCAGSQGNQGCNGGLMDYAFQYVIKNKGIGSEASYKYTARDGSCKKVPSVVTISKFVDVQQGSEAALATALQKQPISIAIEADQSCFQFYHGGVLDDASCGTNLDHGVLAVGLGTDSTSGKDYWRVKNSWGASWGDKGYISLVYGKNQCGLNQINSYPVV